MGKALQDIAQTSTEAKKGTAIFLWVALSVIFFHSVLYIVSCSLLLTQAAEIDSSFAEGAVKDHGLYMVMSSLSLLRGYLIISACYVVVLFPIVKLWIGKGQFTRKSVILRTFFLMLISLSALIFRMMAFKPYFVAQWIPEWQSQIMPGAPGILKSITLWTLLNGIPIVILLAVSVFWIRFLLSLPKAMGKLRFRLAPIKLTAGIVLSLSILIKILQAGLTKDSEKPNIIIIASDSLRPDHLSCNGYERKTSPNIDRLAAQSQNFTKCFTPIGSTLESMIGLFSSQYPHSHGARQMFPSKEVINRVNNQSPKLPQILADSGYETAVIGDWCSAIFNEVPMGFENVQVSEFDSFRIWLSQALYLSHPVIPLYFDNKFGYWLFPKLESFAHYLRTEVVTDRAIAKIKYRKNKDRPFFYTIFTGCNHFAYHAPYPYYEKWTDPDYKGPNKYQVHFDPNEFVSNPSWDRPYTSYTDKEKQHIIDLYDGCVSRFDECVGRILETLKQQELMDNTIILITSDHGEDLFEPNTTITHGVSFNGGDQGNLVPCILYVPGMEPKKIDQIVRNIDMSPTLLELTQHPNENRFEGVSLMPCIENDQRSLDLSFYGETGFPFIQRTIPGENVLKVPSMDQLTYVDKDFDFHIVLKEMYRDSIITGKERCLRTEEWKLVFTPGAEGPIHRLYHIPSDPNCTKDVSNENPEILERMKYHLWQWIISGKESRGNEIFEGEIPGKYEIPSKFQNIEFSMDNEDHST
ncbi:MAG: sulfatase [Verrucomicrobiota bacterium]|nr:sulfatase [Verrucomicrobiota bacterium]